MNPYHLLLLLMLIIGMIMRAEAVTDYIFAVVPKRVNSPYWRAVENGCMTRARVLSNDFTNITCLFTGPAEGGPDTEAVQLEILESLIEEENVDGIALAVVEEDSATEMINRMMEQGIPTITFDSDAVDSARLAYIGTNNFAMGEELGRVLLQVREEGGKYGIIGAGSPNILLRENGVRAALAQSDWEEVPTSSKDCEGNVTLAVEKMHELVSENPDIDAIIPVGAWPMLAGEEWQNFIDQNPEIIAITGDSLQEQIEQMNMGYGTALVGQLPFEMGKIAIDQLLAIKLAEENGEEIPFEVGRTFYTSFIDVINIPQDLPPLIEDMNYLGKVVIFGYLSGGIVMFLSIFFSIWTLRHRKERVIKAAQPYFLIMICVGTLILGSTVIPLSVDDQHFSQRACNIACNVTPYLVCVGSVTSVSALFSKTWRINKVFHNPQNFTQIVVTERDVILPFAVLFSSNIIVLICWSIFSPMTYVRQASQGTDAWNRVYKSYYGSCVSTNDLGSTPYVVILIFINLVAVAIANYQAYQARNIHVEFSESRYIGMAMLCVLQSYFVGIPLLLLMAEDPVSSYIVKTILVIFTALAIVLFIFAPKFILLKDFKKDSSDSEDAMLRFSIVNAALPQSEIIRASVPVARKNLK